MCIASVIKGIITPDQIKKMADHNPDGGGLAWISGPGMIAFRKGLTADDVIGIVEKIPRPFLLHFRIATRGGKRPELTHPFPIGFEAFSDDLTGFSDRGVLIHNGSSSSFDHLLPKGLDPNLASDTQIAAYAAGFDETVLDRLTWSNALLRPNGSICARGSWTVEDGNHYSNMHWKTKAFVSMYGSRGWEAYDSEDWANWRNKVADVPTDRDTTYSGPRSFSSDRSPRQQQRERTDDRSWKQIKQDRADAKRERKLARRAARRSDGVPMEDLDTRETEPMHAVRGATIRQTTIPSVPRAAIVTLPAHLGTPSSYPPTVRGPQLDLMIGRGPACQMPEVVARTPTGEVTLVGDPYDARASSYTFQDSEPSAFLDPAYAAARDQIQRDRIKIGGTK